MQGGEKEKRKTSGHPGQQQSRNTNGKGDKNTFGTKISNQAGTVSGQYAGSIQDKNKDTDTATKRKEERE